MSLSKPDKYKQRETVSSRIMYAAPHYYTPSKKKTEEQRKKEEEAREARLRQERKMKAETPDYENITKPIRELLKETKVDKEIAAQESKEKWMIVLVPTENVWKKLDLDSMDEKEKLQLARQHVLIFLDEKNVPYYPNTPKAINDFLHAETEKAVRHTLNGSKIGDIEIVPKNVEFTDVDSENNNVLTYHDFKGLKGNPFVYPDSEKFHKGLFKTYPSVQTRMLVIKKVLLPGGDEIVADEESDEEGEEQVNSSRRGRIAAFGVGAAVASRGKPLPRTIDLDEKRFYDEEMYSDDDMEKGEEKEERQEVSSGLRGGFGGFGIGAGAGLGLGLVGGVALGSALAAPYAYGAYGYPYGYNYGYGYPPPVVYRDGRQSQQQTQSRTHPDYVWQEGGERRDGEIYAIEKAHRREPIKDPFK